MTFAHRAVLAVLLLAPLGCSSESLVGLSGNQDQVAVLDLCAKLPELSGPVVIDGSPDLSAPLVAMPRETWRDPQNPMPSALGAEYLVGWAPEGIYFYAQVDAPDVRPSPSETLWCGDAVHLFLDGDGRFAAAPSYDRPGTRQFIVAAPLGSSINTDRASTTDGIELAGWSSSRFGAFPRSGGYSVEAVITAADLGANLQLAAQAAVAWSLSVSFSGMRSVPNPGDSACEGLRLGDVAVALGSGACVSPHCNVDAFCTAQLVTQP